jgi:hypothetical protein
MPRGDPQAAIGVRPKTGWAALVALSAEAAAPEVILRERVEITDPAEQISRFVFHSAAELELNEAEAFVASARRLVDRLAGDALMEALRRTREAGFAPAALAVVGPVGTVPPLNEVLKAHTAIHAGEGAFYAEAWAQAGERAGLKVVRLAERAALSAAAKHYGISDLAADEALRACGKEIGAPWGADQRAAAAGAWAAL